MEKFEAAKTVASMEAPSTTMSFAAVPAVETTTGTPEKLRLNFYVPHDAPHDGEEVRSSRRESSNRIAGSRARSGVHRATRAFASSRTTRTTRTNARCMRTNAGLCTHRLVSSRIASHRDAFHSFTATDLRSHRLAQVDMVLVPATTGDFGILPGHVPTVSQLRPGVVSVHVNDKDVKKYFVSGGFAFVHADSTADVCAVEAVPVEHLDGDAVRKGLAEHQSKFASAKDDYEKAQAQIGIDVCGAMVAALEAK